VPGNVKMQLKIFIIITQLFRCYNEIINIIAFSMSYVNLKMINHIYTLCLKKLDPYD